MIIDYFQNQNLKNSEMSCLVTAVLEITECFSCTLAPNPVTGQRNIFQIQDEYVLCLLQILSNKKEFEVSKKYLTVNAETF